MRSDPERGTVLVGLDGGATKLAAHEVVVLAGEPVSLALGAGVAEERVPRGFAPVALDEQLAERESPRIDALEREAGRAWVAAAARAIAGAAGGRRRLRLGVCMPGLKTADERGVCVLRHGPRMPRFTDELEAELASLGFDLVAKIPRLIGDGEACGLGELAADGGSFRGCAQAYYVGGGTGVAEAIVLDGVVRSLDSIGVPRAWELRRAGGECFEDLVSMKGINARAPGDAEALAEHVEERAVAGERTAARTLVAAAEALAELVALRAESMLVLADGPRHLERVVVGQRTAALFTDVRLDAWFRGPLEHALASRIARIAGSALPTGFLRASRLRAAPAIGAAASARSAD
ncbi:MAG: hypothetical protein ACKVXR_14900 [Planctomycetota bacterium]